MPRTSSITSVKITAGLNVLLGAWLIWSPWEYGVSFSTGALNSWIVGAMVVIIASIRMSQPERARGLSLLNMMLGIWLIVSPWIFGYAHEMTRLTNSVCVGILAFLFAASGFF